MRYFNIDPDTRLAVAETDTEAHPNELGIMGQWLAAGPELATGDVYCEEDALVPLPPRPGPWAVFDHQGKAWTDPRTPADLAAELVAVRRAAAMDKSDLLIGLVAAAILTAEEAEEAASGAIPARIAITLEGLPVEAQMAARIKWRTDTTISRMHPVIVATAYALGVSDAALDAVFGIH